MFMPSILNHFYQFLSENCIARLGRPLPCRWQFWLEIEANCYAEIPAVRDSSHGIEVQGFTDFLFD